MADAGPATPPAPPAAEPIGFAVEHPLVTRNRGGWQPFFLVGMYLGVFVIACLLVETGLASVGLGAAARPAGWVMLALFLLAAIHWKDALPRAAPSTTVCVQQTVDDRKRVWCVWAKWRLRRLAAMGPIVDEAFEPEVFAAPFAAQLTMRTNIAWLIAAAGSFGVLYVVLDLLGQRAGAKFHLLTFCSALAMGWLVVAAAMPTSIRVVPGRIDVMRGWFFSPHRPIVRSLDLRGRRVIVDVNSGFVFVTGPAQAQQEDSALIYGPAKMRARLARAILRAAVSSATPAPLPDNAAIG